MHGLELTAVGGRLTGEAAFEEAERPSGLACPRTALIEEVLVLAEPPAGDRSAASTRHQDTDGCSPSVTANADLTAVAGEIRSHGGYSRNCRHK